MKPTVLWVVEERQLPRGVWHIREDAIFLKRNDAAAEADFWRNYYSGSLEYRVVPYVRRDEK